MGRLPGERLPKGCGEWARAAGKMRAYLSRKGQFALRRLWHRPSQPKSINQTSPHCGDFIGSLPRIEFAERFDLRH